MRGRDAGVGRQVLKPGGHFLCLEFSRLVLPVLRELYDAYSFNVIPKIGRWVPARHRKVVGGIGERVMPEEE